MSRYRKIEVRTWSDEKFRALSKLPPSGQSLWFFLLTGPHTGPIPGLFRAGRAQMAEELEWSTEAFDEAFAELSEKGMAQADFKAKLVWLPNALKHNRPESPNVVVSWRSELDLLPECDLKKEAMESLRAELATIGDSGSSYVEAFDRAVLNEKVKRSPKKDAKPTPKASAKPSKKTTSNQEQEQEQEQEEKHAAACAAGDESPNDADELASEEKPETPPAVEPLRNGLVLLDAGDAGQGADGVLVERRAADRHPDDIKAQTWRRAKALCDAANLAESTARAAIGKMVADYGIETVFEAVRVAEHHKPVQPIAFLKATCQRLAGEKRAPNRQEQLEQRNLAIAEEIKRDIARAAT